MVSLHKVMKFKPQQDNTSQDKGVLIPQTDKNHAKLHKTTPQIINTKNIT